jgi:serine/threonine protein kinase
LSPAISRLATTRGAARVPEAAGVQTVEWLIAILAMIATSVALVALGIVFGRLGILTASLARHWGRTLLRLFTDLVRFFGGLIVALVLVPVALGRLLILKPARALDAIEAAGRESLIALKSLASAVVLRPMQLVGLGALARHVGSRLRIALGDAPEGGGVPVEFEGYTILRELARGGSGARLFVAEPDMKTRRRLKFPNGFVVIKSFDFDQGTEAAEMLREGRSLDAARKLGLVLDHEASERRFHYVMRYYEGVDLGRFVRGMHEAAGEAGLDTERLVLAGALVRDIVATLRDWHRAGLWHKDIKPENAIVHEGRATLVDLGLVTPLASHMTLTTHGTEYFRDPELVRQALRGARVSEVDAARFDVYGAGAVLYFVLEGTFPAHGVLSSFRRKSPACLQWIARRAMADFDRRYRDAEEMLADLDRALLGGDPAAVRPADLPSMGADSGVEPEEPSEEAAFLAKTLPKSASNAAAAPPPTAPAAGPPDSRLLERPRVAVTNWWTGAYSVVSVRPLPPLLAESPRRGLGAAIAVLIAALVSLAIVVYLWLWNEGIVGFPPFRTGA